MILGYFLDFEIVLELLHSRIGIFFMKLFIITAKMKTFLLIRLCNAKEMPGTTCTFQVKAIPVNFLITICNHEIARND